MPSGGGSLGARSCGGGGREERVGDLAEEILRGKFRTKRDLRALKKRKKRNSSLVYN